MYKETDYLSCNDLNEVEKNIKEQNEILKNINQSAPDFSSKEWKLNDFPYIQEIDRIEKGVDVLGEYYYKPDGWIKTREWLNNKAKADEQIIKSFSYQDINRWINNYSLMKEVFKSFKTRIVEGTRIEIDSPINQNSKEFTIYGASEQETRSGKNLLPNYRNSSQTYGGITYNVNNDGSINVNGNATTYSRLIDTKSFILKKGTYYLYNSFKTENVYSELRDLNGSSIVSTKSSSQFILNEDTELIFRLYVANGTQNVNTVVYPMITSNVTNTYEPYGVSPSPDYPSEVKTLPNVRNLLGLKDKKQTTTSGLTYSISNNEITINGTATVSDRIVFDELISPIKLDENKNYKISISSSGEASNLLFSVQLRTSDKYIWGKEYSYLLTKPYDINNINETVTHFGLYIGQNYTFNNFKLKIQIEEGTVAHDYVPYGNWLRLDNKTKNMLYVSEETRIGSGITAIKNSDGSITINGTATGTFYCNINTNYENRTKNKYIILEKGKSYTAALDKDVDGINFVVRTDSKNYPIVATGFNNRIGTVVYNEETDYSAFGYIIITSGKTFNNVTIRPMLLEGAYTLNNLPKFEPYRDEATFINLDKENIFDGEYELGQINVNTGENSSSGTKIRTKNYIPIIQNSTYNILINDKKEVYGVFYKKDKTYLSYSKLLNNENYKNFKVPNEAYYIRWHIANETNIQYFTSLTEGTTSDYELAKIDDVRDELEVVSGKGIQRIRHIQLKVADMNNYEDYPGWKNAPFLNEDYPGNNGSFSSYKIKYKSNIAIQDIKKSTDWFNMNTTGTNATIFLSKSKWGSNYTQTYWKENYPNLIIDLYYELAEEQPFEIEPTNVKLFEGYNKIELLTDVDTEMECEYYYETGEKVTIWNLFSYVNWNEESDIEWSDL